MEPLQSQISAFQNHVNCVMLIVSTNPCGVHGTCGNGAFFLGSGRRAALNAGGPALSRLCIYLGEHLGQGELLVAIHPLF
jgi:hypothetical protein